MGPALNTGMLTVIQDPKSSVSLSAFSTVEEAKKSLRKSAGMRFAE
jgi:hypothetical protein